MNTELRLLMEFHKVCPHCKAAFDLLTLAYAQIGYWHFDGYCKKSPEVPMRSQN